MFANFFLASEKLGTLRYYFSIAQHLEDEEPNDVVFYVLLRAVDRFYEEYNLYPGFYTQQVEADVNKLKVSQVFLMHLLGKSFDRDAELYEPHHQKTCFLHI